MTSPDIRASSSSSTRLVDILSQSLLAKSALKVIGSSSRYRYVSLVPSGHEVSSIDGATPSGMSQLRWFVPALVCDCDDDLALRAPGFDIGQRVPGLLKWEHLVDNWPDDARLDQ